MKSASLMLLEKIEQQEMLSLAWGFADGSLSRPAVLQLAQEVVVPGTAADDPEELLEYLIARCLVLEIDGERIRSRFAESVRLLSRLRQLFPGKPWFGAPRLVNDFRVDLRRRKYPRRDRSANDLLREHAAVLATTPLRKALWSALSGGLDLASFQERATLRLLEGLPDSGTIITAGTGSGKTMAFYLPALMRVAESVQANEHWVKVLAIYPRVELLKDQLSEVFARSRGLDHILRGRTRPISVGALFGSTPNSATASEIEDKKWQRNRQGFVCPWFKCPSCGGDLVWRDGDINQRRESLNCAKETCDYHISDDILVLTRGRLVRTPPDILFTTTEMLNQRMSDLSRRSLFGIGMPRNRKPLFTLLDEVHTYAGTTGAQSALVLRRWRHLLGDPVTWCGLSATLGEASRFFSELIGVDTEHVVEITPGVDELIDEGAEYQIILKGDPTLQASLLSTSIQATMLVARMLDASIRAVSEGAFGSKVFVFTDDLDVTNRLFDTIRDAEAYNIFGKADNNREPLAALRGPQPTADPLRDADGQRWRTCEAIGHNLKNRLRVGRTTSQDAGVLSEADVIVATSTLEVGYNDPLVGAVLQHKSPRNMASFLQRKGRSGRLRGMRPLTITVLSDYGRDRVTFEAYEHLFDPALPPQFLPISNQYILRMQAVFAMLDWLCADASAGRIKTGWTWDVLSRPTGDSPLKVRLKERLKQFAKGEGLAPLVAHLKQSLHLDDQGVASLLWDPPRSLVLEVIPTLVRRLFRDWSLVYGEGVDLLVDYHPLPDFIPRNLFSDLSLPEVQLILPPATVNGKPKLENMPIVQALQQLAPGRVTRRFAHERGALCHWAAVDVNAGDQELRIGAYAERNEHLGIFEGRNDSGRSVTVGVYRPWTIRLAKVNGEVLPSSNAFPVWFSGFEGRGTPVIVATPSRSPWLDYVTEVRFYLHRFRGSVAVRRFAPEARCNIRRLRGDKQFLVRYRDDAGNPAAVGFELEVDGMYLDFDLPSNEKLLSIELSPELRAASKLAFHRYLVLTDPELPQEINPLQREWLHQILMSAATTRALLDGCSLGQAAQAVLDDDPMQTFSGVLASLFALQEMTVESEENAEEENEEDSTPAQSIRRAGRLEESLRSSLGLPIVIARLRALAPELDCPTPVRHGEWLRRTIQETLAEAVLQACINTAPRQAATDSLVADIEPIDHCRSRVWITETTLGGAGVIQAFAEAFSSDPRSLFRALEAALAPTDLELASEGLKEFVKLACNDTEISDLTAKMRATADHHARAGLRRTLNEALSRRGVDPGHAFSVSLNARILRTGSSPHWDSFLALVMQSWDDLETRFGVSIGVREMCFAALQIPKIRTALVALVRVPDHPRFTDAELIQILGGILWPRGIEIRQRTLQSYNPFRVRRVTDPALVRTLLLGVKHQIVHVGTTGWQIALVQALETSGTACLVSDRAKEKLLRSALIRAIAIPVDVGYLQFYPVIERIERTARETRALLSLREYV